MTGYNIRGYVINFFMTSVRFFPFAIHDYFKLRCDCRL